jgi:transcriptional regulator with XRE-family HTH domain
MLRAARGNRSLRAIELATGVSNGNLSVMERGLAYPNAITLKRLCAFYGLSFDIAAAMIANEKSAETEVA